MRLFKISEEMLKAIFLVISKDHEEAFKVVQAIQSLEEIKEDEANATKERKK